jgi:hypothetical protein
MPKIKKEEKKNSVVVIFDEEDGKLGFYFHDINYFITGFAPIHGAFPDGRFSVTLGDRAMKRLAKNLLNHILRDPL